jgi:hypothetical protein
MLSLVTLAPENVSHRPLVIIVPIYSQHLSEARSADSVQGCSLLSESLALR